MSYGLYRCSMAASDGQDNGAAPAFAFAHIYNPQLEAGRGEQFSASAVVRIPLSQHCVQQGRVSAAFARDGRLLPASEGSRWSCAAQLSYRLVFTLPHAAVAACAQRERQEAAIQAAWDAGNDFQLPMGRVDDALDTEGVEQASLDASIPVTNRGFQMLQRMGWSQGKGLGVGEDGELLCFGRLGHNRSLYCPTIAPIVSGPAQAELPEQSQEDLCVSMPALLRGSSSAVLLICTGIGKRLRAGMEACRLLYSMLG